MRRGFLSRLLLLAGFGGQATTGASVAKDKILIKSAWGSGDPTQASFPFHHKVLTE